MLYLLQRRARNQCLEKRLDSLLAFVRMGWNI
jgi:hypothetical protein